MQSGFTILEHPSDVGIEASGATLAEAFEAAARGLMSIVLDLTTVASVEHREVRIDAADRGQLLVRWLSEILFLFDGRRFVPAEFRISLTPPTGLTASVAGEPFSPEKHRTRLDVKAVTYHQLSVEETAAGATVRVFLDI